mmetsp:Transcript_7675/g.11613  ORF Transcript_7675/g.11613 Transcript_7675/m.11613 type:complete len:668 (-) Transcript_7675:475-2478(-)
MSIELQNMAGDHSTSSSSSSSSSDVDTHVVDVATTSNTPSSSANISSTVDGYTISWKDLNYVVPEKEEYLGGLISRNTGRDKTLLNQVSGVCKGGESLAIMGPSGCGKSTLLDVLSGGVRDNHRLTGQVLINGEEVVRNSRKKYVAYVMQDDALNGVLTVRENLYYSAMLRLPNTMSRAEKLQRVEETIEELGLSHCANTKVGNVFFRGISGGERRRTSIGMELITRPSVLLLDEPTSGLDAKSARLIIELLVGLAKAGRSVVCTIHQPSTQVFRLFDKLLLLSKGEQVYYGRQADALSFFASKGQPVDGLTNPADHYLEVINYDFTDGGKPQHVTDLIEGFASSPQKQTMDQELSHSSGGHVDPNRAKYDTSWFHQFWYLCDRTFWSFLRDPGVFWARVIMYSMMAIMMGTLYLRMDDDQDTIQDRISVLFFSVAFLCFMAIAALPAFLGEREIFIRERRNAYYSVSPYAVAHTIVGIPFVFLIAASFTTISYFTMGMHETAEAFFYFMVVLTVALINSEGLITAISAIVPSFIVGIAMGAGFFGMYMLVCGFFLRASNIPDWWIWMHYIVFHKYAFEGFMVNEFEGSTFACDTIQRVIDGNPVEDCACFFPDLNGDCEISGEEILTEYEYEDVDKWAWLGVLIGMGVFYCLLFYVFLRWLNKGER